MRIKIEKNLVLISDELDNVVQCSTDQLLEMIRVLDLTFMDNGTIVFETLEFTV